VVMIFNATFNNISAISCRSVLLVLYMIKLEGMDMFLSFNSNTTDVTSRSGTPTLPKNLILTRFLFGFVLFNR
jgi:hypothetical protein